MKDISRITVLSIISAFALTALVACGGRSPVKSATSSPDASSTQTATPSTTSSETTSNEKGSSTSGTTESDTGSASNTPSNSPSSTPTKPDAQLEEEARSKGLYVLKGRAHAHYEDWNSGKGKVMSVTLDEPVQYEFTYKGTTSTLTAKEVEVALEGSATYSDWTVYDGEYVVISCESLNEAIHDASMQNVDAIARNPAVLYTL